MIKDLKKKLLELEGRTVRLITKQGVYVDILKVKYIYFLTSNRVRQSKMYIECGYCSCTLFSNPIKLPRVIEIENILSVEVVE